MRVLVVDDEPLLREILVCELGLLHYETFEAESGNSAIALLKSIDNKIDLVISDVVMPHGDGRKILAYVRSISPDIKFLFMSGFSEITDSEATKLGSNGFIKKPFNPQILMDRVAELLQKKAT